MGNLLAPNNQYYDDDLFELYQDEDGEVLEIEWTPPQSAFLQSEAVYPLFVGGFGSGKSITMAGSVMQDLMQYPGAAIGCYAPTYDLLLLITVPNVLSFLDSMEMEYDYNKSRYIIQVKDYGAIIFRSLDNPGRIVGYQTFRSHLDELDTLPMKKAEDVWNKVIARNRQKIFCRDEKGNRIKHDHNLIEEETGIILARKGDYRTEPNRVSAYTTPEGFVFTHDRWVKNKKPQYELYKAPTYSNPHLPADYIPNLRATYPENLIEAYLDGEYVNLTSGAVYRNFDRELNGCLDEVDGREPLNVGMDFNVLFGAAVIHVMRDNEPRAVDEITESYDTDATIATLKARYPHNPITVYPDASGDSRTSSNTTASDIKKLRAAGFRIKAPNANPPIKNRVAAYNAMILNGDDERRYKVNVAKCPGLVASLEQQVYDKNGMPDKSTGLDHVVDAPGYYIEYEFGLVKPTADVHVIRGGY